MAINVCLQHIKFLSVKDTLIFIKFQEPFLNKRKKNYKILCDPIVDIRLILSAIPRRKREFKK